jgi:hypothetical protein
MRLRTVYPWTAVSTYCTVLKSHTLSHRCHGARGAAQGLGHAEKGRGQDPCKRGDRRGHAKNCQDGEEGVCSDCVSDDRRSERLSNTTVGRRVYSLDQPWSGLGVGRCLLPSVTSCIR